MNVKLNYGRLNKCLRDTAIEKYLLDKQSLDYAEEIEITSHISSCCNCFERFYDLRIYHQILSSELEKPISVKVIHYVKDLQQNVRY